MAYSNYLGEVPDPQELRATLAKTNRFTLEELNINRTGRIADTQMVSLTTQAMRPIWTALMTLGGWLLILLVIYVFVPDIIIMIASLLLGKLITTFLML